MNDDLGTYCESLDRLEALDIQLLLPGHGLHRRDNIAAAFARSRGFVAEFERRTRAGLREAGGPTDLFELSLALTTDGRPYKPASRWWVHMALVDSHLQALIASGEAEVVDDGRGPVYRAV
jgi:glyoxylase-like metal-dependent hydrolase (beta-lactamase superfamily II)